MPESTISLREHLAALREADERAINLLRDANAELRRADQDAIRQAAEWTKERLASHNELLKKWEAATERDRQTFVSIQAFDALKEAFDLNREVTSKALALAEGKTKGVDTVRIAVSFVIGIGIALVTAWGLFKP